MYMYNFLYDQEAGWISLVRMYVKNWEGSSARRDWTIETSPPASKKLLSGHPQAYITHESVIAYDYKWQTSVYISTYYLHLWMEQTELYREMLHVLLYFQVFHLYLHLKSVQPDTESEKIIY